MSKLSFVILIVFTLFCVFLAEEGDSYFGSKSGDTTTCHNVENDHLECDSDNSIDVIFTFTNAVKNDDLQKQFILTVTSLFRHATIPLNIHIIGEEASQNLAEKIMAKNVPSTAKYKIVHLDVDHLATELADIVEPMQERFSYKKGSYYNHALFFLSTAIHRVMPSTMHRAIMMDVDLKFRGDIKQLYDQFSLFDETHVMGLAREMQPVYRHLFWYHRRENPGTRVGDPPPNGLTGFNSGVLLLDLDRMRSSQLYNSMLERKNIESLADEFRIKGHLGDQDFFTLLGMVHEELFYVLPCVFNRQLSSWWKDHGYKDVFHLYHDCEGDVLIYHGNGKTKIPDN
ncbi:hypothetical protein CAPTEDRAFT_219773 [Capitella teleta]|uniref:Xyloside xylosyltransferase 1 n=1 Tax=Capitella teleta TaxID=283909 RepID=R7UZP5_CAPTE|nr:hypothetical protein CAPTEDRAFT_219773 [Capitella teleta]|eukprot:ELU12058.1 hypothetical protein CAPTEDRAFT_219773 [Capitella teleta]